MPSYSSIFCYDYIWDVIKLTVAPINILVLYSILYDRTSLGKGSHLIVDEPKPFIDSIYLISFFKQFLDSLWSVFIPWYATVMSNTRVNYETVCH